MGISWRFLRGLDGAFEPVSLSHRRLASPCVTVVAMVAMISAPARVSAAPEDRSAATGDAPQVASRSSTLSTTTVARPPAASTAEAASTAAEAVANATKAIGDCKLRFAQVRDYTCTFHKRERLDGKLTTPNVMLMKARANPTSIYFKFQRPNKGREAIYVAGRNGGKLLAHDVGIGKFLAGTMSLDPRGPLAMEDCLHPITEAGIGALIDMVSKHWSAELTQEESRLTFHPDMRIGTRSCTMIESVHPTRQPNFLFHKARLYIDHEHGLPIRFEGYDWPKTTGAVAELLEEYTYTDLRLNVGLTDKDFDPNNRLYSFGRF
jgi:hypothetical protein